MIKHGVTAYFLLLLSLAASPLLGYHYALSTYSIDEGLPQSQVMSVTQGAKGLIWMGTYGGGLVSFDGRRFTAYTTDDGLPSNVVWQVSSHDDDLWVGTEKGLALFREGRFTPFLKGKAVLTLVYDPRGNLWVGTRGSGLYKRESGKFNPFPLPTQVESSSIWALNWLSKAKFYLGTGSGLWLNAGEAWEAVTDKGFDVHRKVWSLLQEEDGGLLVGTNGGLYRLKGRDLLPVKLPGNTVSTNVWDMLYDQAGTLWLATDKGIVRKHGNRFSIMTEKDGLSRNRVWALTGDQDGGIWMGTDGGGLVQWRGDGFIYYDADDGLPDNYVLAFDEGPDGNLWVGTLGGLARLKGDRFIKPGFRKGGRSEAQKSPPDMAKHSDDRRRRSHPYGEEEGASRAIDGGNFQAAVDHTYEIRVKIPFSHPIWALHWDHHGALWIGTDGDGLFKYDGGSFQQFTRKSGLAGDLVRHIYEDEKGILWIATQSGVSRYDGRTFKSFTDGNGLPDTHTWMMGRDSGGDLWCTTNGGLAIYRAGHWYREDRQGDTEGIGVFSGALDSHGTLWLGTYGNGVQGILTTGKKVSLTRREGLLDDQITALAIYGKKLWIGSNHGINTLDLDLFYDKNRIVLGTYGRDEGFRGGECNLNAIYADRSGHLWVGTVKGATRIDPGSLPTFSTPPRLSLSRVKLFFKPLPASLFHNGKVSFSHRDNYLTFEFNGIYLKAPGKVRFRYKLDGFDREWSPPIPNRRITYSNLPPGSYSLKVKAENGHGVWTDAPLVLPFVIASPFWRTWWFLLLILIFLAGTVQGVIILRTRAFKREQRRLETLIRNRTEEVQRLSLVASKTDNGVIIADPSGVIEWVNAGFTRMTGFTLDALKAERGETLVDVSALTDLGGVVQRSLLLKESLQYENMFTTRDGEERWFSSTLTPVFNENEEVERLIVVETDISRRKEMEMRLRFLQTAVETMQMGVTITDPGGIVIYINKAAARMHGFKVDEVVGRDIEIFSPDGNRKALSIEQLKTLTSWRKETFDRRRDGSLFPVELGSDVVMDDKGTPVGIVTVSLDITHRKEIEEALKWETEHSRALFKAIPDTILRLDKSGEILDVKPAHVPLPLGEIDEWPGWRMEDVWDASTCEIMRDKMVEMKRKKETNQFTLPWKSQNGRIYLDVRLIPFPNDEILVLMRDITEEREQERLLNAARGTNDGLWDWNVDEGEIYFSPRWKAMLGFKEYELPNELDTWFSRVHPAEREQVEKSIQTHREGLSSHLQIEHRILHRDGRYRWMLCRGLALKNREGRIYRIAGSQVDITDRKAAEEQLLHDSFYDRLTGLPNRALFNDRLKVLFEQRRSDPEKPRFALFLLDLDRFKVINDSLGHVAGDQLIREVASRLNDLVSHSDILARFSGDEFIMVVGDMGRISTSEDFGREIQKVIGKSIILEGEDVVVTASVGIVEGPDNYREIDELLRDADIALRTAKQRRRGAVEIFAQPLHGAAVSQLKVETQLRKAIPAGEFRLFYQPIYSLETERVNGAEGLIRWQHPERGLLYPADFLHLAGEMGLMGEIGNWVIKEAAQVMVRWLGLGILSRGFFLSLNLASEQMTIDWVKNLEQILSDAGLDPYHLVLEITENVIMENPRKMMEVMRKMASLGITLAVDDFGTGYSSLSTLHTFPIEILKIDRSFVTRLEEGKRHMEIMRAITILAQNLNLKTVAEGVANSRQVAQLQALDCTYAQGFYYSEALNEEDFRALMTGEA